MIPIKKQAEPRSLKSAKKEHKNLTYVTFSEAKEFAASFEVLRQSLLTEQGCICCYCQKRIAFKDEETGKILMKTEHFLPKRGQEAVESKQLDYDNLLAVCLGNSDSEKDNHCDSSKADKRLKVLPNPASVRQANFDAFLKFKVREKSELVEVIAADSSNEDLHNDIKIRLNLNEQNLSTQRFFVWRGIWRVIHKNGKLDLNRLKEVLNDYDYTQTTDPDKRLFKAFCGFIVQWYSQRFKNELIS
jgi:uncharacterized protein (TIGR02646 family)